MLVDIEETLLPGIGVRYDMTTSHKQPFSVLIHRDGSADLATYDEDDPDEAIVSMTLDEDEVETLAELLGAPRVTRRIADLSKEIPGLHTGRIRITPGSQYDGHTLGETAARTRSGASVVAVVHETDITTSPGPETVLHAGDYLVAIGDDEALAKLGAILESRAVT